MSDYVGRVVDRLGDVPLYFMQSNGGLTEHDKFHGKDAILSGPAGGVIGAARTAQAAGFDRIIGFDMGGTSTDVALYAGALERVVDAEVAGAKVRVPMIAINTVAAGADRSCTSTARATASGRTVLRPIRGRPVIAAAAR